MGSRRSLSSSCTLVLFSERGSNHIQNGSKIVNSICVYAHRRRTLVWFVMLIDVDTILNCVSCESIIASIFSSADCRVHEIKLTGPRKESGYNFGKPKDDFQSKSDRFSNYFELLEGRLK